MHPDREGHSLDTVENQPFLDMLRRACFRWQIRPDQATGDMTYATVENIRGLEDGGIRAYVPLPDWDRTAFYGPSRFRYDADRDEYRCPQGQPLTRLTAKYTDEAVVYRADPATCNACPVKSACTASTHGRTVQRSFYAEYLDRVRAYHETAAYQKAMRKRSVWVEPLFGEAKDWHGLRRFRLRGLWKVNAEALLIATGQNLKRLLKKRGWGRRPWPNGAPECPPRAERSRVGARRAPPSSGDRDAAIPFHHRLGGPVSRTGFFNGLPDYTHQAAEGPARIC